MIELLSPHMLGSGALTDSVRSDAIRTMVAQRDGKNRLDCLQITSRDFDRLMLPVNSPELVLCSRIAGVDCNLYGAPLSVAGFMAMLPLSDPPVGETDWLFSSPLTEEQFSQLLDGKSSSTAELVEANRAWYRNLKVIRDSGSPRTTETISKILPMVAVRVAWLGRCKSAKDILEVTESDEMESLALPAMFLDPSSEAYNVILQGCVKHMSDSKTGSHILAQTGSFLNPQAVAMVMQHNFVGAEEFVHQRVRGTRLYQQFLRGQVLRGNAIRMSALNAAAVVVESAVVREALHHAEVKGSVIRGRPR
jgi:hypothetical protein